MARTRILILRQLACYRRVQTKIPARFKSGGTVVATYRCRHSNVIAAFKQKIPVRVSGEIFLHGNFSQTSSNQFNLLENIFRVGKFGFTLRDLVFDNV